ARMRAMGIEPPPPPGTVPQAAGALSGAQVIGGRATDVNVAPVPPMPAGPGIPAPGGGVPAPPAPGGAIPPPGPGPRGVPAPGAPAPGGVPAPGGAGNIPPPGNP